MDTDTDDSLPRKNKYKDLFLRDNLAAQRTMLANERTYLAYVRTALTLFVTGVSLIKFFGHAIYEITGLVLILFGIMVLIKGVISHIKMKQVIIEEEHLWLDGE